MENLIFGIIFAAYLFIEWLLTDNNTQSAEYWREQDEMHRQVEKNVRDLLAL